MLDPLFIEPTHEEYKFPSEKDLENFVWSNLEQLLQVSPFKRQYICRNEICDILATNEQKQLVILELKNSEDRYIIQQLTRYYNNLVSEKPFTECIDWEKQIQLIAIAPTFHRHTFIDCQYSNLSFEILQFEFVNFEKQLYFILKDLNGREFSRLLMLDPETYKINNTKNYKELNISSKPSRALKNILNQQLLQYQERILEIREKILSFDKRISEISTSVTSRYGLKKGEGSLYKDKICAEFYIRFFKGDFHGLDFFLWLPFPNGKMSFNRNYDQSAKGIIKIGFGDLRFSSWQTVSSIMIQRNPRPNAHATTVYNFQQYSHLYTAITGKKLNGNSLDVLLDIALEEWIERL